MGEVDPKVIKRTQDTLGKIIKKPPLTEKLLSRPPFRFLHDICTSVIKTTGYMKGLFDETELVSENVKDKEAKVAFLQKLIDWVSVVTEKSLSVRPSSIVGGKDCDKTNELLQALAEAVNKKVNNEEYVARVLRGDGKRKVTSASKQEKREPERDKHNGRDSEDKRAAEKERNNHEEESNKDKDRHRDRDKEGDRHRDKEGDRHRDKEGDRHRDKDRHKDRDREKRDKDKENERSKEKKRDSEGKDERRSRDHDERRDRKSRHGGEEDSKKTESQPDVAGAGDEAPPRLQRPSSAKGHRVRRDGRRAAQAEEDEDTVLSQSNADAESKKNLARPPSVRPAPPKPRRRSDAGGEEGQRLASAGTGGRVSGVIIEREQDSDDDQFVVEETMGAELNMPRPGGDEEEDEDEAGKHGGLVTKMLQTKKDYEGGSQLDKGKKTEIDQTSGVSDAARKRDRAAAEKDVDRLRQSIQLLTRSANPLGKVMDFIQEDLDAMQKELERWRKDNKELGVQLRREQNITDSAVEPLTAQLTELEHTIKEQQDAIAAVKSKILNNDDRISKMLSSVAQS